MCIVEGREIYLLIKIFLKQKLKSFAMQFLGSSAGALIMMDVLVIEID
jgi:hypothetical protein